MSLAASTAEPRTVVSGAERRALVVLVDDDPLQVDLLQEVVEGAAPCEVVQFTAPELAIDWCRDHVPDLVISDYDMAGLNGAELIATLRHFERLAAIPMVVITALNQATVRHAAFQAGASDFLTKPLDAVEVTLRVRNMLALRDAQRQVEQRADWLEHEVSRATVELAERERQVILRLSRAAEYRDTDTGSHVLRIGEYAAIVATELGLPRAAVSQLLLAAPMHDVGKIGITDAILHKPGRFTDDERRTMQQHTLIGHRILSGTGLPLLDLAAEIALSHHEKWDGTGYPNGLAGEKIPLAARIVAVVDVYDALTTARPYKPAWATADAILTLTSDAGTHFDPQVVKAFLAVSDQIARARARLLDEDEPRDL